MKTISLALTSMMISLAMYGSSFMESSKAVSSYNSVAEILRTIDPNILPKSPYEPDEFSAGFIEVLNQKASEIRNYIASKYAEDLRNLSNKEIIILGIILVPFEERDMFLGRVSNQQAFDCMMTAIGAATGIASLISLWNSGATASTILGTLKSILKVSYGWFAVGYAVYKFGDCVGWW